MILEKLRARLSQVMKSSEPREVAEKNILKVAVSTIENASSNKEYKGKPLTEDQEASHLKAIIQGNADVVGVLKKSGNDGAYCAKLQLENEILSAYVPAVLSRDAVESVLNDILDRLRAAAKDEQAMGVAMKHLKSLTPPPKVDGNIVLEVVKVIRGTVQ